MWSSYVIPGPDRWWQMKRRYRDNVLGVRRARDIEFRDKNTKGRTFRNAKNFVTRGFSSVSTAIAWKKIRLHNDRRHLRTLWIGSRSLLIGTPPNYRGIRRVNHSTRYCGGPCAIEKKRFFFVLTMEREFSFASTSFSKNDVFGRQFDRLIVYLAAYASACAGVACVTFEHGIVFDRRSTAAGPVPGLFTRHLRSTIT